MSNEPGIEGAIDALRTIPGLVLAYSTGEALLKKIRAGEVPGVFFGTIVSSLVDGHKVISIEWPEAYANARLRDQLFKKKAELGVMTERATQAEALLKQETAEVQDQQRLRQREMNETSHRLSQLMGEHNTAKRDYQRANDEANHLRQRVDDLIEERGKLKAELAAAAQALMTSRGTEK